MKIHIRKKSVLRQSFIVMLLAAVLSSAVPVPARAEDKVFNPLEWVTNLASWLQEYQHIIVQMAGTAAKILSSSLHDAEPIVTQSVKSHIEIASAQGEVDAERRAVEMQLSGDAKANALLSMETQVCQITHASQDAAVAKAMTEQAVSKMGDISTGRGAGVGGNSDSPAYNSIAVSDLCKAGALDTSGNGVYGDIPQNLGCKPPADPRYIDADTSPSHLLDMLQFPLPAPGHADANRPDGYISFANVTSTEKAPGLGSELDFALSYKFCEHLQPVLATPPHAGDSYTATDVQKIRLDRNNAALRTAAMDNCLHALFYRTSCPAGSAQSLQSVNGSGNCHEAQAQLCAWLKSSHAAGGMGLTMEGSDPRYKAALANCDSEGLSQAMYDAIMAHRCEDRNYSYNVLPTIVGSGAALERTRTFDCPAMVTAHEAKMDREEQRLLDAIQNLNLLRNTSQLMQ